MVIIVCRKRGYVSPKTCAKCKIPDARKIDRGKVEHDRGPYKGDTVSPGSCPWFIETIDTCQTVDTPFAPRHVGSSELKNFKIGKY